MKAVVVRNCGGIEVVKIENYPDPIPGEGEVLIEVEKSSVNFADIKAREGQYHGIKKLPFIPGLDVAGRVVAVGKNVKETWVGERVIAWPNTGGYAELAVANENLTYPISDKISPGIAAAFPTIAMTAYYLTTNIARLNKNENILIYAAAGGVGSIAVQMAKLHGAGRIIGLVGNDSKKEVVYRLGADLVINYKKENVAETVNEFTNGHGVDVILNSVGGNSFIDDFKCLAYFGRLVSFGYAAGSPNPIKPEVLHPKCQSVLCFSLGTTRRVAPKSLRTHMENVVQLIEQGKLEVITDREYSLDEVSAAHSRIESRGTIGKTILNVKS
jgi:NADPH:quinone reductase